MKERHDGSDGHPPAPKSARPGQIWRVPVGVGLLAAALTLVAYVYAVPSHGIESVGSGESWIGSMVGESAALERIGKSIGEGARTAAGKWSRWLLRGGHGLAVTVEEGEDTRDPGPDLEGLIERADRLNGLWDDVARVHEREIAPIERVLLQYRDEPELVRRIARALFIEAQNVNLEPRLLLAVLLVENPWLDKTIRSSVGAVGLMQVMPMHEGNWPPCEPNLENVEANICHGARIFAHYFRAENGHIERALLRYNGCVRGTNTPDCHRYPYHVYARAGRASILAWLRPQDLEPAVQTETRTR